MASALLTVCRADQFNIPLPPVLLPWPADNSSYALQGGSPITELNAARVYIGPCSYRMLHLHITADEMLMLITGKLESTMVAPNNTVYTHTLLPGDNVVYPKGWPHLQYNPECTQTMSVLAFNARSVGTINIPYNLAAAGASYLRSTFGRAVPEPQAMWVTDAACMRKCKAARRTL
ncbi:hypothetical protein HYH03_005644 [Edaphochlamys debaryana]|uniref:Germin-like protein n=1 Tax=Edaphochlamys debaryana TaxID=47281 RepID=A0A835Y7Y0_9CHLO|nr:hypothetical protein HYH03_005644 [Edaphochlamys debaryana]|eukprot:KAG2496418.1 hypothetical protein HYH03_005644 [Edaphochlamys debaryana]